MKEFLDFLNKKKEEKKEQKKDWKQDIFVEKDITGDSEKSTIKDVTNTLSDVEYLKIFNIPADFHYEIIKQGLFSSSEQTQNEVVFLEDFFKHSNRPLFSLIRYADAIKTVIGQRVQGYQSLDKLKVSEEFKQQEKEQLQILYSGLKKTEKDPETAYLLAKNLDPNYIMTPYEPLEKWYKSVSPVFITNNYAVVDSGETSFHLLDIPENKKDYVKNLVEKYKEQMEQNNTISKLKGNIRWGLPLEMEEFIVPFREQVKLFPHIKNEIDFLEDETVFEARSFFKGPIRDAINKDLRLNLNSMSFQEQIYFLTYIAKKKNKDFESLQNFTHKYELSGLRTFLSIEHGGKEMGDKILTLGEKLPEESAKVLFKTYGEMVDTTKDIGTLLAESLGKKATPELINQAKESLLIGGKELLERYAKKAQTCEGIDCKNLGQELEEKLALAKKSVFAFSYACKTLVERGEFSFEDFKKAKLAYDQAPLAEEMQNKILAMHHENTKQYPPTLRDKWRATLKNGLENVNPDQLVVSASYEDDIVSSMRVIKQEDGSWYGASFNVNPTVMGSRIGSELLKKVIEDLAKDKPFVADCYSKNPMLDTYINKFGFQITKEVENYEDTGELVYQITLFPKKEEESE